MLLAPGLPLAPSHCIAVGLHAVRPIVSRAFHHPGLGLQIPSCRQRGGPRPGNHPIVQELIIPTVRGVVLILMPAGVEVPRRAVRLVVDGFGAGAPHRLVCEGVVPHVANGRAFELWIGPAERRRAIPRDGLVLQERVQMGRVPIVHTATHE